MKSINQLQLTMKQLYQEDFVLWVEETVNQLKKQKLDQIDWENLIEEVEDLGREKKRQVNSFLRQLLVHLLLYQYWESEKAYCGNGWKGEIRNFRAELEDILTSKTLFNYLLEDFDKFYSKSRKIAIDKTGLSPTIFPETCPYTVEQVLDSEFLPN
jgi:hypothetical protein